LSTDSSSWVGTSRVVLDDAVALEALRRIMPRINRAAPARHVNTALEQLAVSADPASFLRATAKQHAVPTGSLGIAAARIWDLPHPMRLAIEMAVNESEERRALSGELGALHAAWREADEIAAIADGLTLPPEVEAELQRLREGRK
jgi:hypothetical protein